MGQVYKDGRAVTLLVDVKPNGRAAYIVLNELLARYDSLISGTQDGKYIEKAVTVIDQFVRSKKQRFGGRGSTGE